MQQIGKVMKNRGELLQKLRQLMQNLPNNLGSISAYIVPSDDPHMSEYLAPRDERRAFITGFDGSAGTAVITHKEALLWTDGRYYQQATKQLDENWTLMKDGQATTLSIDAWLARNLARGSRVGVDPKLISTRLFTTLHNGLKQAGCTLDSVNDNLIDLIWTDQPAMPNNKVIPLPIKFAGRSVAEKLNDVKAKLAEKGCVNLVLSALDEIAWFLNLRGSDIDYNPVFFSYVLITAEEILFFVDESKLSEEITAHFTENGVEVTIRPYNAIRETLQEVVARTTEGKTWLSWDASISLTHAIPEEKRHNEVTPVCVMKAVKNEVEAQGLRNCHIRDGLALCQYFAWLEQTVKNGDYVDEISGATKLEEFRSKQDHFMGLSFTTISASGPNGSVIHYHPRPETNRPITDKEMYLCDSGAQFLDGTTDVTRTMHFGEPTPFQRHAFTRVLKGQMALGLAVFPRKTKGQFLDTIARKALWDVGLDYAHGTGHGIGHFLNVHEGPMGIGVRAMPDDPGLQENMFLSNEPGYYEDGEFGIRIEDIVQVISAEVGKNFGERGALKFDTVTICPIQTKLVDVLELTETEKATLNQYHERVYTTLAPLLTQIKDQETLEWLKEQTKPI